MENKGRTAFVELVEARIAVWQKNIQGLELKLSKKDNPDAREIVARMKARVEVLTTKAASAAGVPADQWPGFKSEADLILEGLEGLQKDAAKRLG